MIDRDGRPAIERPTCKTCPFWEPDVPAPIAVEPPWGECRRLPAVMPTPDYVRWDETTGNPDPAFKGVWPSTAADEWCGEHPGFTKHLALRAVAERNLGTIADLGLTVRVLNCLKAEGILTVSDLLDRTDDSLWTIRGFGEKCVAEVRSALAKHGLALRPEPSDRQ
jgi:hypothetical protein